MNGGLDFPDLSVLGANSQIKAKGTYSIDRRMLDFSATIYPFMESKSILQLFNAISAPISAIFRVRLTGSIDKPSWGLAWPSRAQRLLRVSQGQAGRARQGGPRQPSRRAHGVAGRAGATPQKRVRPMVRNTLPRVSPRA